jgi:hypothetical protein
MDSANYCAEAFSQQHYEMTPIPSVYTNDAYSSVIKRIEQMREAGELIWPVGIPRDEIWVKIVGDKGDGSSKLGYQIVNRDVPNSIQNTALLGTFEGVDTYDNMLLSFGRYRDDFDRLDGAIVCEKTLKLFICGDCEFLSRIFGVSSASSKHPCFYCHISSEELKVPTSERRFAPLRTIETVRSQNAAFMADGGQKCRQKFFGNAIHVPIFNIPISRCVPPWLHINLGLVLRIHEHLLLKIRSYSEASAKIEEKLTSLLRSKGIDRSTYHSNQFHGNACHLYLTWVRDIFSSLSEFVCLNLGRNEMSDREMRRFLMTLRRFEHLLVLYREIDNFLASVHLNANVNDIRRYVSRFMRMYRKLGLSCCLKSHILEDHLVPYVLSHGVSLGLMGEQGIESVHYGFKHVKTKKTRNRVAKLLEQTRRFSIKTRVKHSRLLNGKT